MRPIKVRLNKLAVVDRQIDTAIWLWFNGGDIVSIVTLTGAALGVLDGLFQRHRKSRPIPFNDEMAELANITPRKARNLVKLDETFAKHARTDPEETREYTERRASVYLFCAVAGYNEFAGTHQERGLRSLFALRYAMFNEHLYNPPPSMHQTAEERLEVERLKNLSTAQFFQELGGDFVGNPPRPDGALSRSE
jgi:hypothetical protein